MPSVTSLLQRPHVRVTGETAGFWEAFGSIVPAHIRGNDVPDAHLVALMRQNGVRSIYSRDRGFRRFDGIEVLDLPSVPAHE